jgi:acetyl esterase
MSKFIKHEQDAAVYDERMTLEIKAYVVNLLKKFNPSVFINGDVNLLRKTTNENALKANQLVKFDNLETREVFISSQSDNHQIPVTLFTTSDVRRDTPIVVFIHGGGFTFDSRETHYHGVASLAAHSRTIWISIEYRLTPEHKFDTQLRDCKDVLERVLKNRAEFGGANDCKIGICGDSAGGNLAAVLAHEYKKELSFQVLIYPLLDFANKYDSNKEFSHDIYLLTPELLDFFGKNLISDPEMAKNDRVSPMLKKDFSNLPKSLIVSAELDPLVDQAKLYEEKSIKSNSQCDLRVVKGTTHGFFSNGLILKTAFNEAQNFILDFLLKI